MRPIYDHDHAQSLGITLTDVASALALATDGIPAGTIREGERDVPILVRSPRGDAEARLFDQIVFAPKTGGYIPLQQVIDALDVQVRYSVIARHDRAPTISVQSFTLPDVLADAPFRAVRTALEALELPAGYRFEWGGESESAGKAQQSLGRQMPLAFGTMLLITALLFGKLR